MSLSLGDETPAVRPSAKSRCALDRTTLDKNPEIPEHKHPVFDSEKQFTL